MLTGNPQGAGLPLNALAAIKQSMGKLALGMRPPRATNGATNW